MLKKLLIPLMTLLLFSGCIATTSTLDISPDIQLPQQDPSLIGVTVSVNGADQRPDQALAKVNRNGKLITLTPSRDLRFLLQEVLEKQMTARGYMIGPNADVDLQIVVNKLYADVSEGDVRHNITTKVDITIFAQAKNGNKQEKSYQAIHNIQGTFRATNDKITSAVNNVLASVITDMANDSIVNGFIKKNAR